MDRFLDRFVLRKAQRLEQRQASSLSRRLFGKWSGSISRMEALKTLESEVSLDHDGLAGQAQSTVAAFALGLPRCVRINAVQDWDTHEDSSGQNDALKDMFSEPTRPMELLHSTPG